MKALFITALFLKHFSFLCQTSIAQSWEDVGTNGSCGDMGIDGNNNIYTLSHYGSYGSVGKFDGTTWTDLGNPFININESSAYYTNLYVSSSGTVYVTYHFAESQYSSPLSYVSSNSGSGWSLLGNGSVGTSETHFPVFDPENQIGVFSDPIVSFNQYGAQYSNYIKSYSYGEWTTVSAFNTTYIPNNINTSILPDHQGNSILAYYDQDKIYVKKFKDGVLTNVGTPISVPDFCTDCISWKLSLGIDPSNNPYFVHVRTFSSSPTYFKIYKYNGNDWDVLQGPEITSNVWYTPSIEIAANGIIYLGYTINNGTTGKVVYYNGSAWNELGIQNFGSVSSIKLSGNILYKDGCEKFDISGIEPVIATSNLNAIDTKILVTKDNSGIIIKTEDKTTANVEIVDMLGKVAQRYQGPIEGTLSLPLDKLGVYIVKIESTNGNKTQKIFFQ